MWTIRINGHPTVTCRTPEAALTAYRMAQHWKDKGHDVALYRAGSRELPGRPWTPGSAVMAQEKTPKWHLEAACRNIGKADLIFFPVRSVEEALSVGAAKEYCDACPVLYACLKAAFDGNEFGTWGGMTRSERLNLRSKMKPSHLISPESLRDFLEIELPACSVCARHRKDKEGSGMCAECFYAERRRVAELPPEPAKPVCQGDETETCANDVHARNRCVKHYHAFLRAQEAAATVRGKERAKAEAA